MPKKFELCISNGGRVRTKVLSGGRYMPICIPKGRAGRSVAGEVHRRHSKGTRK